MSVDDLMNKTSGSDPSTDATASGKDLSDVNVYEFMDHAHDGKGGFRDGTYLIPHKREVFYKDRKKLSYYKNFLKPILRAMLEPVFDERVGHKTADWEDAEKVVEASFMSQFVEDCNGAGMHLQEFMKVWVRRARLHGVAFAVMDNFPEDQMPEDAATAMRERKFPYLYLRKASQIPYGKGKGFELDDFGVLTWIIFSDRNDPKDKTNPKRWRKWTTTKTVQLKQSTANASGFEELSATRREHKAGVVPVMPLFAVEREDLDVLLVDPPLYDLARLCHALFNKTSEIRSQERSQGFAIFYIQTDNPGAAFTIGDKTILFLPMDTKIPPGFAAPDANILEGLVKNEDRLREDIFRIAEQNGVTGVQSAKSGVAMQWDFFAHESVLKATSTMAVVGTDQVARMFNRYVVNEQVAIYADYPTGFQPNDKDKELTLYDKYNLMNPPTKGIALSLEKATRLVFSDEDPQRVAEVIEQIKEEATDEVNAEPVKELDAEGNPVKKEPAPDLSAPDDGTKGAPVAPDRVLNGAQVSSMVAVVVAVGAKEIERNSAIAILEIAFGVSQTEAEKIVGTGTLESPKKVNLVPPPKKEEDEEDDDGTGKSAGGAGDDEGGAAAGE